MATFGETVIHMITSIISGIINTIVNVLSDLAVLFGLVSGGELSLLAYVIAIIILTLLIFGLYKLFKGQVKPLIIAIIILAALLIIMLFL